MKNNKGLSLVELIVAFAITAIAGVAVFGLMSAGSNHFNKTGKNVGLQYEQQISVNKIRDVLLEASDALSYDDVNKILVVYNQEDLGPTAPGAVLHNYKYKVTKIYLDGTDVKQVSKIFDDITSVDATTLSTTTTESGDAITKAMALLGQDVKDISFDLSKLDEGKIGFNITFESSDGGLIESDQIVSLRNRVLNSDNPSEIFGESIDFVNSFIDYIVIYRNSIPLAAGATTEIAKNGSETVTVPFDYKIVANEYSEYSYVGKWSLRYNIAGMSVDEASGVVTVDGSVPAGTTNTLVVTSVDDPSKYQSCEIVISDTGVYPQLLTIEEDGRMDYNGHSEFSIHPVVTYTDNTTATDSTLCTWTITPILPDGCSFSPEKNMFTATSALNGVTVKFVAKLKAPTSSGTYLVAEKSILIKKVKEYIPNQNLKISGVDSRFNSRGKDATILAYWTSSTSADFTYHWRVSRYGDSWSDKENDPDRMKFDKTVSFSFGNATNVIADEDGFYHAISTSVWDNDSNSFNSYGYTYLYVKTPTWLDWSKEYDVEIECYATDRNGKRYGEGNDLDGDYQGPVSVKLVYEPVKVILKPTNLYRKNLNDGPSLSFNTGQELRFSSNGQRDNNDRVNNPKNFAKSSLHGGDTVRVFEIAARGVSFDSTDTSAFALSASKFTFYNTATSKNEEALTDADIKSYFSEFTHNDFDRSTHKGFRANMDSNNFKNLMKKYEPDKNGNPQIAAEFRPNYVSVTFSASDKKGNVCDTYYVTGEDYYNDSDITNSRDYRYKIKYDSTKLNDQEYIEILK